MKRKLVILSGCLAMMLCPVMTAVAQTAKEYRQQGIDYWQKDDYEKAYTSFKKAVELGDYQSLIPIGNMYKEGLRYGKKDFMLAAVYYGKAASCGLAEGYSGCGYVYYYGGNGLQKDEQKGISCLRKASEMGSESATAMLKRLGLMEDKTPKKETTTSKGSSFKWISPLSSTQKKYRLRVGIKSPSTISDVIVRVNGQNERGIKTVADDGYDIMLDREVTLALGANTIRVVSANDAGKYYIEKTVTYTPGGSTGAGGEGESAPTASQRLKTSERRVALVIGNGNYQDSNLRLNNAVNDAADMAAKLVKLGFVVVRSLNQTKKGIDDAVSLFSSKAKDCDVALFYYAGHGIQYKGYNYMVPVDAQLPSEEYVAYNCTNASLVLDVMENAGSKMKIVILDACRNNPFARSWHRSVADGGGLATMNAPKGTFVAYSTAPGDVALDGGEGQRNSPYTAALLKTLDKKGLSITDFFQEVLEKVVTTTNERQNPWTSNSFRGKFVFNPQ